jgi:hypothetical protein
MTKKKPFIYCIIIIMFIACGGELLFARHNPGTPQPAARALELSPQPKPSTPLLGSEPILATTSPAVHSIDWVSLSPSSIASGSSNPVVITAQITDPAVIRNSVNLIYISPTGTPVITGTLNDSGLDGDAIADDNIFTIIPSLTTYPTGTINFRISAAFAGSLARVQTGTFTLNVLAPVSTSGWTTMSDSQKLFSIQIPSAWNLVVVETPGDDVGNVKNVHFEFPDGTIVFTVNVFTASSVAGLENGDGPIPIFLGQGGQYAFGLTKMQISIDGEIASMDEIVQDLPQILATFKVL